MKSRRGLSAVLTTLFTVSEGFGIMEGSQLGPQASLPMSLVNDDEVIDVLISSLFKLAGLNDSYVYGVASMKFKMLN